MASLIGQQLGQYEIVARINKGGMATIYRARQKSVDRDVAVKVIKPELIEGSDFLARFRREARTVAALSHPHILKVFDYGEFGDVVYLVMELLSGGSLADVIRRGAISPANTSLVLDQVASALDFAHRRGIIHRDMKPPNVLLDTDGNAFLTDFGIARLVHETTRLTQSGAIVGTPAYMAPEQWNGEPVDARTDVYALGVMLFEMLTGRIPFNGDTPFRMMHMHMYEPPPSLRELKPDMPAGIDAVLAKALAKTSDQRFPTAGEVAKAFRDALAGKHIPPVQERNPFADNPPTSPFDEALERPVDTPQTVPLKAEARKLPEKTIASSAPLPDIPDPQWSDVVGSVPVSTPKSGNATRQRNLLLFVVALIFIVIVVVGAAGLLASGVLNSGTSTPNTSITPAQTAKPSVVAPQK